MKKSQYSQRSFEEEELLRAPSKRRGQSFLYGSFAPWNFSPYLLLEVNNFFLVFKCDKWIFTKLAPFYRTVVVR